MIWSYFRDKILKCDEITKLRNYENTEGTSDIGDYVNSSIDEYETFAIHCRLQKLIDIIIYLVA